MWKWCLNIFVFWSNYPVSQLTRRRRLRVRGVETGTAVFAEDTDEDEVKYDNSSMVMSPVPGVVYVMEWSGQDVEQHVVDL